MRGRGKAAFAGALAATLAIAGGAAAQVQPAGVNDYGGFRNVLAVGQGANASALEVALSTGLGTAPASYTSQRAMYTGLLAASPTLMSGDVRSYFKTAGFGVDPVDVVSTETPRPGVTILRDRFNVPHVYGATRADVEWGAGYVSGQDRMFMMDVLRHYARGRLAEFAGPGARNSNIAMDFEQIRSSDYTEAELQRMIDDSVRAAGTEGPVLLADLNAFVDGVNAFIHEARADALKLPGEYALLAQPLRDWRKTDTVAVATLIGGIFGRGGGAEVKLSQVLQAAYARFGRAAGRRVFDDFRRQEDPEAPVTVTQRFPFQGTGSVDRRAVALPDLGSVRPNAPRISGSGGGPAATARAVVPEGISFGRDMSSAILVRRGLAGGDRPIAVMGPQVGFYSPEILMELDLHGGGIDARGAAFPGISLYVLLGRGADFAWSATTATSDNVDQFVERLCEPDGSKPTLASTHYLYKGRCISLQRREHVEHTTPNASDRSSPRTIRITLERSVHGPIQGRATVQGRPVAYAEARSTYMHELDSTIAFKRLNDGEVHDARSFQRAASRINFLFNWFYVDDRDIAYLQSGWFPLRARGTDPSLPTWGTGRWDWQGFDPGHFTSRRIPARSLPKAIDPARGWLISWNNKQAPGWRAADDQLAYGPVHRYELLERGLRRELARAGGHVDVAGVVRAMENGATQDLRGADVYPLLRRVIGTPPDAEVAKLLAALDAWVGDGAHRRDLDGDNVYEHSAAIALMDAWWEPLVRGIFEPVVGRELIARVLDVLPFSRTPNTKLATEGSAFGAGWWGYLDKDLRSLLHRRVRGRFSRRYCGSGSRVRCRAIVVQTLRDAAARVRARDGADMAAWKVPATCAKRPSGLPVGAPLGCDQIELRALGGIVTPPIPWQNRPTFQQVVQVQGHRAR